MPQFSDSAEIISYKPSAFYFRRAIRSARTIQSAKRAGEVVLKELEQLQQWADEQGLEGIRCLGESESLSACETLAAAKESGLCAVLALERLKAAVRDQGVIPPKWSVLPDEAEEKGWH